MHTGRSITCPNRNRFDCHPTDRSGVYAPSLSTLYDGGTAWDYLDFQPCLKTQNNSGHDYNPSVPIAQFGDSYVFSTVYRHRVTVMRQSGKISSTSWGSERVKTMPVTWRFGYASVLPYIIDSIGFEFGIFGR